MAEKLKTKINFKLQCSKTGWNLLQLLSAKPTPKNLPQSACVPNLYLNLKKKHLGITSLYLKLYRNEIMKYINLYLTEFLFSEIFHNQRHVPAFLFTNSFVLLIKLRHVNVMPLLENSITDRNERHANCCKIDHHNT
ncbi:hypothetical protein T4A_11493 [Trichinella pseudospiralis]|uniref:Uncharacterized protein n=1 Tax=Trichinella pseudospiralis TaxID=6337 RepID=A0A0V1F185_TRIPS|nr:hypothetical protein T4A_11493 [Trichinella pseudospiralis]